jgi:serine-type D-Ala-D-Ala carboxypeptidase
MSRRLRYGDAEEAGMSAARVQHIRQLGAQWVEFGEAASLNVVVARRGVVVVREAYGTLGPELDAPPLPLDAVYPLASVTKPVKNAVMVHHLFTHTSGITPEAVETHAATKRERGELEPPEGDCPGLNMAPLSARVDPCLYDVPLQMAPGTQMSYCNLNYAVVADIVARVAGMPAEGFAEERLLKPLGMVDTCLVGIDPAHVSRLIRRAADDPFEFLNHVDLLGCFPGAGSGTATAWDMAVFWQMLLNGGVYGDARVLSPASVAAMTRDQVPGIPAVYGLERFDQAGWGYGWNIKVEKREANRSGLASSRTFEHSGAGGTSVLVDPEHELVLVYLSAETSDELGGIHQWCMDHLTDAAIGAIVD